MLNESAVWVEEERIRDPASIIKDIDFVDAILDEAFK